MSTGSSRVDRFGGPSGRWRAARLAFPSRGATALGLVFCPGNCEEPGGFGRPQRDIAPAESRGSARRYRRRSRGPEQHRGPDRHALAAREPFA